MKVHRDLKYADTRSAAMAAREKGGADLYDRLVPLLQELERRRDGEGGDEGPPRGGAPTVTRGEGE